MITLALGRRSSAAARIVRKAAPLADLGPLAYFVLIECKVRRA
jgi:hypothetical protein